jgi:hypothetical protein
MTSIYLHAVGQFISHSAVDDRSLKEQLKTQYGVISRRSSRLTLLALLGAMSLQVPTRCGVYTASSFSSPQNMHTLLMDVCNDKTLRPFNFINSINNALPFYIAEALGLQGANIFVAGSRAQWRQPLILAWLDLCSGVSDNALVGWCHERKTLIESSMQEGSHWLLLSNNRHGAIASVTLEDGVVETPTPANPEDYYFTEVEALIQTLTTDFDRLTFGADVAGKRLCVRRLD